MRLLEATELKFYKQELDIIRKSCPNALLKVAIYARKSTEDTSQTSIQTQIEECKKFIGQYPELFSFDEKMIFTDENISGKTLKRKGFQTLLNLAKSKQLNCIVCHYHDRFSRKVSDEDIIEEELATHHVHLIFGNIYFPRDASGKLIKSIMYAMAENEADKSAEKTAAVLQEKAKSGTTAGGQAPFGYKYVNKQYVQEPNEAPIIKELFALAEKGLSYKSIQKEFKLRGYKTRTGNEFAISTISDYLHKELYAGTYIYCIKGKDGRQKNKSNKRILYQDQDEIRCDLTVAEPIIRRKQFNKVQDILTAKIASSPQQDAHSEYILSGLIRCNCGANVCGESCKSKGKRYRYYTCQDKQNCTVKKVNAEKLENVVKTIAVEQAKAFVKAGLLNNQDISEYTTDLQKQTNKVSRLIHNTEIKRSKAVEILIASPPEIQDDLKCKIMEYKELIKANERKKQQLAAQIQIAKTAIDEIDTFNFDELMTNNKRTREFIRLFISEIVLCSDEINIITVDTADNK